jgi:hypothetical protein
MDDDPLTSPSFPAINTSDSRSYRTRQSGSGQPALPPEDPRRSGSSAGRFSEPTQQYTQYPPIGDRPASAPNGYPVQPPAAQPPAAQAPPPVANPYGSYVSAPVPAYQEPSAQLGNGGYDGYGPGQQGSGVNGYGNPTNGYLPASGPGSNGSSYNGHTGYNGTGYNGTGYNGTGYNGTGYNGSSYNGYSDNGYGDNGYPADYQPAVYPAPTYPAGQAPQPAYGQQGHVNGQYDPRVYGPPDLGYGQDGYQGYPGYGGGN